MHKVLTFVLLVWAQLVGAELVVSPEEGLVDGPLSIRAEGLTPGALVTLIARVGENESQNVYLVDENGSIDLSRQAPVEGSYQGVDPMGPIWSIERGENFVFGSESFEVALSLCGEEVSLVRRLSEKTERVEVREEGVVGTLFLPHGMGPFPGAVVLGGSEGGISERRARLLASHGFAVFALGYFGAEGLPSRLQEIALEDVIAGVDWFRERVSIDRVGLYGVSRGGELSLLLGSLYPDRFAAIAVVVPSSIALGSPDNPTIPAWTLAGEAVLPVPFPDGVPTTLPLNGSRVKPLETVHFIREVLAAYPELAYCARIPVENITCPVLLISGGRDGLWPSSDFCEQMVPFLKAGEHLYYPEAGHAIGVPNLPSSQYFHVRRVNLWLSMGGTAAASQEASVQSWDRVREFLKQHVGRSAP
jgi:dienelactone hydrolase